jgi:ribosomal protein L37AE/L43A
MNNEITGDEKEAVVARDHKEEQVFLCDRCGSEMVERNCKVICLNCGYRFDCSDLTIYFD